MFSKQNNFQNVLTNFVSFINTSNLLISFDLFSFMIDTIFNLIIVFMFYCMKLKLLKIKENSIKTRDITITQ